ncbi:IS1 family transposase, partial [Geitlerinema sp. CS-897]|nr:IS1 family transposase [Geitlerinema sp. CS-897]
IVKNGSTHNKKPKFKCKECGRQFVEFSEKKEISNETKAWIDDLLLEKISSREQFRARKLSRTWLQNYVNQKYQQTPRQLKVSSKKKGKLILECDELLSFVKNKKTKIWIWLAIDRKTREIVGFALGDRIRNMAQQLWDFLPPVYRQCAVSYTDLWEAYEKVFPSKRLKQVGKETGETSHIERFNNTLRQRISRLVRKTLSFSKKSENHIGAILTFIHHYNECINECIQVQF